MYPANVIAAVVSVVISLAVSVASVVYNEMTVTPKIIITVLSLSYMSFLCATVGYDKVVQAIRQVVQLSEDKQALNGDK